MRLKQKVCWRGLVVFLFFLQYQPVNSGALQLNMNNFNDILTSHEFLLINLYVPWCKFSQLLEPIFDEAADLLTESLNSTNSSGKLVLAKLNCDDEAILAKRFQVYKYPTIKIVRSGMLSKKEYRGPRTLDGIMSFVKVQIDDPIREFKSLEELEQPFAQKDKSVFGYFLQRNQTEYVVYRQVATTLRDLCSFHVGFGEAKLAYQLSKENVIVFKAVHSDNPEEFVFYKGDMKNFDELSEWMQPLCMPIVREITFANAEEISEEGLPLLLLFYKPNDLRPIKEFTSIVERDLVDQRNIIQFLTADGIVFRHPLHHLGMSEDDLPLVAIDSFKHMYLFPHYKDIHTPGKLKQFIDDLYSGKLHTEFHYGPLEAIEDQSDDDENDIGGEQKNPSTSPAPSLASPVPPESKFKELLPSKHRYTIIKRDEL